MQVQITKHNRDETGGAMEVHTDDVAEQKAQLRQQFPGWNFIVARPSGRWWALKPGGDAATPPAVIADTPSELAMRLGKLPAR